MGCGDIMLTSPRSLYITRVSFFFCDVAGGRTNLAIPVVLHTIAPLEYSFLRCQGIIALSVSLLLPDMYDRRFSSCNFLTFLCLALFAEATLNDFPLRLNK